MNHTPGRWLRGFLLILGALVLAAVATFPVGVNGSCPSGIEGGCLIQRSSLLSVPTSLTVWIITSVVAVGVVVGGRWLRGFYSTD